MENKINPLPCKKCHNKNIDIGLGYRSATVGCPICGHCTGYGTLKDVSDEEVLRAAIEIWNSENQSEVTLHD